MVGIGPSDDFDARTTSDSVDGRGRRCRDQA